MDRFDKFTDRARKVLTLAQDEAQRFNHNYIGTEHLLLGLVREGEGVAARVLENMNVELAKVRTAVEFIIGRGDRPVVGEVGLTPRAKRVIELAIDEARRLGHNYIGTEHLLLGLVREGEGIAAGVLESRSASTSTRSATRSSASCRRVVLGRSRPGDEARQQDPDGRPARHQPHRARPGRQARPGHRPREGDRAGHPDPLAPQEEQPGADRRARRRQDGHRRGPRPSDRRRRRPGDPAEQARPDPRHRLARRRHEVPRRVRGAPQEDHRGAPEHERRGPLHRRAPHARRRRRGRGRDRRGEHPQAAAVARRAPVHRRDDARRVPQVHRARRGPRAPLPAGHGRGADARADRSTSCMGIRERYEQHHKVTITDDGREGRGRPVDPLHHRPPPAGQGDRPHRRGRVAASACATRPRRRRCARRRRSSTASRRRRTRRSTTRSTRRPPACARPRRPPRETVETLRSEWQSQVSGDQPTVDEEEIAQVVAMWTGIPVTRIAAEESERLLHMEDALHNRVIGQQEAIEIISKAVRRARAGLKDPEAARSARSSSSAPPASGRRSSRRPSPSSCSAARTRSSRST